MTRLDTSIGANAHTVTDALNAAFEHMGYAERTPSPRTISDLLSRPGRKRIRSGQNAAKLRTIMMEAKRYIPMNRPMPMCIKRTQINQASRVRLLQMKNG